MNTKSISHNATVLLAACLLFMGNSGALATVRYVDAANSSPAPPYTNWLTAAANIQDAVNEATTNDVVLVTNGTYAGGVNVVKPLALLSVNGPQFTIINGGDTSRCVSLADGTSLTGFTLTNGVASFQGGGVYCASTNAFLTNCIIAGNVVLPIIAGSDTGGWGGGVFRGTLYRCTVSGNQAVTLYISNPHPPPFQTPIYGNGGAACGSVLHNCTVESNSAQNGSGVYASTLYNCTLTGNFGGDAFGLGGGAYGGTLYDCTLTSNTNTYGGGVCYGTLHNCKLTSNYANTGGGTAYGTLSNCTLTGNSAGPKNGLDNGYGGGAFACDLYSCTLTSNSVNALGGGAYGGTVYNCLITGNSAAQGGGTSSGGLYYNCTVAGNTAGRGGGTDGGTFYNCIFYFNTAVTNGANYLPTNSIMNHCCTSPPISGAGNIEGDPLFVDTNGWSNLRLQSNSPCVNTGTNGYVTTTTDLDGRPRIVGGRVDMGAYEFQPGVPGSFIGWLQQYNLPTDGSADSIDSDGDSLDNWQEWICRTCPTNAESVLRLLSVRCDGSNVAVTWQSVPGVNYFVECCTNLAASPCFSCVATNIPGQADSACFVHTNAVGPSASFYRVGVIHP